MHATASVAWFQHPGRRKRGRMLVFLILMAFLALASPVVMFVLRLLAALAKVGWGFSSYWPWWRWRRRFVLAPSHLRLGGAVIACLSAPRPGSASDS